MRKVKAISPENMQYTIHNILERRRERSENEDEEDTPVTRFLARFFRYLIKGFDAKDKTIRYRVVQIVAETVSSLTYIEFVARTYR